MKADIKIRPLIKLIPHYRGTFKFVKYWFRFSIYFDWLIFTVDIDNFR